ncbi:unannotated protein [freshwater metagenome]|uniref:Unannotated protein n=1 Tax=freshwater metagenome TaxID=449393 RepID=A0A6J7E5H6_9ZZZZ|nr:hypothetical protein [Actinomycetota bacterium]
MAAVTPLRDETEFEPSRRAANDRRPLGRVNDPVSRTAAPAAPKPAGLQVVPRRRRNASIVATCSVVMFLLLLGAVAFQTKIAQNQLALDTTERAVKDARERYDVLRRARAELRSPNRLSVEAAHLGMVPATSGAFMTVSPQIVASMKATAGWLSENVANNITSSFDQFGAVKAVAGDTP